MADEVERLVVSPFREIVEKANTALENARDAGNEVSAPMLKAAQGLAKEGERALKRIEPLCQKNHEEYGVNFIDAIKEHDEIAEFRSELEDLLWDFDDYVEVDEFNADKFDELQRASRKVAPKIMDILKRMKLSAPAPAPASATASIRLPQKAGIVVDAPSTSHSYKAMGEVEQQLANMLSTSGTQAGAEDPGFGRPMAAQAGPDLGIDGVPNVVGATSRASNVERSNSYHSRISEEPLESPPRPPSGDPWQVDRPPPLNPNVQLEGANRMERRPTVSTADSPTLPVAYPATALRTSSNSSRMETRHTDGGLNWAHKEESSQIHPSYSLSQGLAVRNDSGPAYWRDRSPMTMSGSSSRIRADSASNSLTGDQTRSTFSSFGGTEPPRYSGQSSNPVPDPYRPPSATVMFGNPSPTIPEHHAVNNHTHTNGHAGIMNFPPRQASLNHTHSHPLRQPSTDSLNSSIFDCLPYDGASSPVASTQRTSSVMSTTPGSPYSPGVQLPQYSARPPVYHNGSMSPTHSTAITIDNHSSTTLTTIAARAHSSDGPTSPPPIQRLDDPGLIPVASELPEDPSMPARQPDCSIGPHSSFYQLKGFCKGAEGTMRGEPGFKKTTRPVGQGFSMTTVAKCKHCLYELDFKIAEQDLKNDPAGNFTSSNVGFRLRFLQKSHLYTRHIEEQVYGCVFCIQDGKTPDESDATVFFTQKQLFLHMARHPRPLPHVDGLTVIDGDMPRHLQNNFDINFPNPPLQSVMSGIAREVGKLPSAVATETRKNAHGIMRSPPDRGSVLHFAVGAKIVGIEFPAKYEGKWGVGWHDGVRAAFEAESVHLDAPPRNETRMQGTSSMQAIARWKWSQKGGEGNWLKFDKGDVIKNISWTYSDHWCWSGTSSKGWGIFPQSHLEPNSTKTVRPDAESISSSERKSALSRFTTKRNAKSAESKFGSIKGGGSEPAVSKHLVY